MFISETLAQDKVNKKEILSTENGRFVFGQISDFRRDQFMLDTQTGRLWQIVETEDKQQILQPVLFKSLDGIRTITPEDPDIQLKRFQDLWDKNNTEQQKADGKTK